MNKSLFIVHFSLSFFLCFIKSTSLFAQAQIVLGNTSAAYIVMSSNSVLAGNPIYMVLGNNATNALVRNSSSSIISNGENNILKWNIGTTAGTYSVPWAHNTGNYIPLSITTAGSPSGSGAISFSTYRTTWQNSSSLPTGITNYDSSAEPGDASSRGVDRFWSIDATGYTTKPDVDLVFTYIDGGAGNPEISGGSNSINESNLQAQRWNSSTIDWEATSFIQGTVNEAANTVTLSGASRVSAGNLFKWWTIIDKNYPLPIEWLYVSADCKHKDMLIQWATSIEKNSDYYVVERSTDGSNFFPLSNVVASGNTNNTTHYSYLDKEAGATLYYYRIKHVDYNGSFSYSTLIAPKSCLTDQIFIYTNPTGLNVEIEAITDGNYTIKVYDLIGQLIACEQKQVNLGKNHYRLFNNSLTPTAIYIVSVFSQTNSVIKKIYISK